MQHASAARLLSLCLMFAACRPALVSTPLPIGPTALPGGELALCGLKNVAWTLQPLLLRSARPGKDAYACLAQAGIGAIVDQTGPGETDPEEPPAAAEAGIAYFNLGLKDDTAPSPETLQAWFETVDAQLVAGHIVLVHDSAGRGRIGFWEAAFLMRQGVPPVEAIEDRYLGYGLSFMGAKIGCEDGGNGQVQALTEISQLLSGEPYIPARDEYGTVWQDCARPDYMAGWDYALELR
jgi:hypothetical protein